MYTGDYGKVLGDGHLTTLSPRIYCEESRKKFSTNIVSCFAGTLEGAWFYGLAKPIRVVLISLILIPSRSSHYIDQPKYLLNNTWRRLYMSQLNWSIIEI